ncbi:hypothetical protein [Fortiea contorta]|uniref:hypothetical protein n=1 Tax=Fortiea contorta TaxID=1892405 RepID=UPI000344D404|nr:hypothetical protein [Fortiea contorta]
MTSELPISPSPHLPISPPPHLQPIPILQLTLFMVSFTINEISVPVRTLLREKFRSIGDTCESAAALRNEASG